MSDISLGPQETVSYKLELEGIMHGLTPSNHSTILYTHVIQLRVAGGWSLFQLSLGERQAPAGIQTRNSTAPLYNIWITLSTKKFQSSYSIKCYGM